MTDRTYPFDPLEICDVCGCLGAFDIMGDFICPDCLEKERQADHDYDGDEIFIDDDEGEFDVWEEV